MQTGTRVAQVLFVVGVVAVLAAHCAPGEAPKSDANGAPVKTDGATPGEADPNAGTTPGVPSPVVNSPVVSGPAAPAVTPAAAPATTGSDATSGNKDAGGTTTGSVSPDPGGGPMPAANPTSPTGGSGSDPTGPSPGPTPTPTPTPTPVPGPAPDPMPPAPTTITVIGQIAFDPTIQDFGGHPIDPALINQADVFLKGFPETAHADATGAFTLIVDISGMNLLDTSEFGIYMWKTLPDGTPVADKKLGARRKFSAAPGDTIDLNAEVDEPQIPLSHTRDLRIVFHSAVDGSTLGEAEHCKIELAGLSGRIASRFDGGAQRFVVDYLPPGAYHLTASCDGHVPHVNDILLNPAGGADWTPYSGVPGDLYGFGPLVLNHL